MKDKETETLKECLEILHAVECLEYHNKNWLPQFAIHNPGHLRQEKIALLERALKITGTSGKNLYT